MIDFFQKKFATDYFSASAFCKIWFLQNRCQFLKVVVSLIWLSKRLISFKSPFSPGLSAIAITAPSDKFLYGGGVLGMGFAALFAANIASMFVPMAAQPLMYSVVTYGGVVLFSGFILHYTQGLVHRAKAIPPDSNLPGTRPNFDPVNK